MENEMREIKEQARKCTEKINNKIKYLNEKLEGIIN
jgi:hypothetical protein